MSQHPNLHSLRDRTPPSSCSSPAWWWATKKDH